MMAVDISAQPTRSSRSYTTPLEVGKGLLILARRFTAARKLRESAWPFSLPESAFKHWLRSANPLTNE